MAVVELWAAYIWTCQDLSWEWNGKLITGLFSVESLENSGVA